QAELSTKLAPERGPVTFPVPPSVNQSGAQSGHIVPPSGRRGLRDSKGWRPTPLVEIEFHGESVHPKVPLVLHGLELGPEDLGEQPQDAVVRVDQVQEGPCWFSSIPFC